jgi:hypothetical protein
MSRLDFATFRIFQGDIDQSALQTYTVSLRYVYTISPGQLNAFAM